MVIAFIKWNPFHHKIYKVDYDGGEYNGYVAFDAELPKSWQGGADFGNDDVLDHMVNVHGGITLDNASMEDWLNEPIIPLTAIPEPEVLKKLRVIGFDTLHCDDTKEKWPIGRVKEETLDLKKQIEELISQRNNEE